jgi:hypothetical protein
MRGQRRRNGGWRQVRFQWPPFWKVKRERDGKGNGGVASAWLGWGGSGAEGERFRAVRVARWPSASLAGRFQKRNEKKIETGWAAKGFWAKIRSDCLRKIKIVFDFLIQGNGLQIKRFKYF